LLKKNSRWSYRKLQVLKKETAGAATGNCRCLKREQLAGSLRPTLHIGNG
jgi:hypothetical protein